MPYYLRGGDNGTNYDAESVARVCADIEKSGRRPHVMIDFSHANSQKQFKRQMDVCADVCQQIANGSEFISGVMIESHLVEGRQELGDGNLENLAYGQSVTDACIGWEDSEKALFALAEAVEQRRAKRA
ncbi:phospho-2-dehydro-3-deoxyheptonate aldolase [Actinobacillus equuli]|nr:phospho-2-dehydro-3-deoxyheptonate aldolase [Actinobacillus equuli]